MIRVDSSEMLGRNSVHLQTIYKRNLELLFNSVIDYFPKYNQFFEKKIQHLNRCYVKPSNVIINLLYLLFPGPKFINKYKPFGIFPRIPQVCLYIFIGAVTKLNEDLDSASKQDPQINFTLMPGYPKIVGCLLNNTSLAMWTVSPRRYNRSLQQLLTTLTLFQKYSCISALFANQRAVVWINVNQKQACQISLQNPCLCHKP